MSMPKIKLHRYPHISSTSINTIAYIKNDIIIFKIFRIFILSIIYLSTNIKNIPPNPYTNVKGPLNTPLDFSVVFLYNVDSIMNPKRE